jgi:hypothetical protein
LLDPDFEHVQTQSNNVYAGSDLRESIQKTLGLLCREKEKLPIDDKENLLIKTYNSLVPHSIILIDKDIFDNAWIKIEERPVGSDSNSRPSDTVFRKRDEDFFTKRLHEYQTLFNSSNNYKCPF